MIHWLPTRKDAECIRSRRERPRFLSACAALVFAEAGQSVLGHADGDAGLLLGLGGVAKDDLRFGPDARICLCLRRVSLAFLWRAGAFPRLGLRTKPRLARPSCRHGRAENELFLQLFWPRARCPSLCDLRDLRDRSPLRLLRRLVGLREQDLNEPERDERNDGPTGEGNAHLELLRASGDQGLGAEEPEWPDEKRPRRREPPSPVGIREGGCNFVPRSKEQRLDGGV